MTYLKEYLIHNTTYGIEKVHSRSFQAWKGGCAIGKELETEEACIEFIEGYARRDLEQHLNNLQSEAAQVHFVIKDLRRILDIECKHVDQKGLWCRHCGAELFT